MKFQRLVVALTRAEFAALQRQASAERRVTEQQASYLLAQALRTEPTPMNRPVAPTAA